MSTQIMNEHDIFIWKHREKNSQRLVDFICVTLQSGFEHPQFGGIQCILEFSKRLVVQGLIWRLGDLFQLSLRLLVKMERPQLLI
jgi:hypothetical protein